MNPELIRLIESNEIQIHGDVEYFAELVAAAEREACAQICDTESANESSFWEKGGWAHACGNCAALIRARGEK
jgi:DNA-binding protein YbaB